MFEYLLRLFIMVPLIGAMIWGSLWLWRKTQLGGGPVAALRREARVVEVIDGAMLPNGARLAVVRYRERELLIAVNRTQTVVLSGGES
jgi:flagellar protein FliO/FliZ